MKQIQKLSINKQAQEYIFKIHVGKFLKILDIDELIEYLNDKNIKIIYFETIENERILLSGYLPISKNKIKTKKFLLKSAMAKVVF